MEDNKRTWQAKWITSMQPAAVEEPEITVEMMFVTHQIPESAPYEERLRKPALLRRAFEVGEGLAKAELRITARGLYHATINGEPVGPAVLTPDYTAYSKVLMYQTYDVTDLLQAGENVWGVELGDGWYVGRISATGTSCQYGDTLSVLGELELTYADGHTETICTDDAWRCSTGKYVYSDLFIGEKQDLRLDHPGWELPGFDASAWDTAVERNERYDVLIPQEGPLVVAREVLDAVDWWREGDAIVVDFGQVICGRTRLECLLAEGQEITLEHAEVVDAEGHFFNNIQGRNKEQTDVYVGRGAAVPAGEAAQELLEPRFSFHGFRYVRITGWDDALQGAFDPARIQAIVIRSDLREMGTLTTSDDRINQLWSNILWSARGNLCSIPTDCPQRERAGWTGDAQIFAPTSMHLMDTEAFWERWLRQVRADQGDDGQILDYSPAAPIIYSSGLFGSYSSAGWGDAIIMIPWMVYQHYGHTRVLEDNYEAMLRWHEFSRTSAAGDKVGDDRYVWDTKFHYGDWMFPSYMLGPDAPGPIETSLATKDLVATAFLANSSALLARITQVLGREEDARGLAAYAGEVRRVFVDRFYLGEGWMSSEFQGCYVLPLAFDLLPEEERQATADHLAQMVTDNGDRLDTGFLSVPYLLDVLGRFGHGDLAERVFMQDTCPSWLYEVDHGATTIWESWGAIQEDGTVDAYSFNHYAFGCVGDWMVRVLAGLTVRKPGFASFDVRPGKVTCVNSCSYDFESPHGPIHIAWQRTDASLSLGLTVPEGTTAHVHLGDEERVLGPGTYTLTA